ncbi:MAG: sodium/proline symporter [Phycisphaerales bacterium]|nr:MAG: sodium/proline symporter [Phycisphaerales bacterium]
MTLAITAFCLYLVLMIGVGVFCARFYTKTMGDFYLGGRQMNDWVVALSAVVSGRSSWLILGVSGIAFAKGISAVWAVVGYITVELFMFIFVGKRLRRYTHMVGAITLPDFYEARFRDRLHVLRLTSVIIIVVFMVFYISAQLTAGGKTFCQSFAIGDEYSLHSVLLTAGIVVLYTLLGGFVAVSLTDVLQGLFMLFGLVVLPIISVIDLGGLGVLYEAIKHAQGFPMVDPLALGLGGIVGYLGVGLGSPGNPHILVRYMSIKRPELLRKSALVGTVWNVLMAWGAVFVGLVARAQVEMGVRPGEMASDPERIFPSLAAQHLHPFVTGLMIAAVFAAIMSTVDSQLLVASSAISRDLYQRIIKGRAEVAEKRMILLSRVVILVMVVVATVIAAVAIEYPETKHIVFWLVLFAWGGLGASFGSTLLPALFWKGTTSWGVFAGLISGTVITIVWKSTPQLAAIVYELIPAFGISFVLVIVVSLMTKRPEGAEEELSRIAARYRTGVGRMP